MGSSNWPARGTSPYWKNPVASSAALPTTGVTTGEIRLVLDTDELYEYNGATWQKILSASTVSGPASAVDGEIVLFDGATGKLIKRATGTGVVHATSGVYSVADVDLTTEVTGALPVANGGTNSSIALNNNRVIRSASGSIAEAAAITAARALVSDANGIPTHSTTTTTEIGFVNGVTSAIQTQLDNKQPLESTLTALAAYNTNGLITQTAPDTFTGRTITAGTGISVTNGNGVAGNPTIDTTITQYTDELAQDAVGGILTDTATIDFIYNDGAPSITADVKDDSITNAKIKSDAAIALTKLAATTASRALVSDGSGVISPATTTASEIGFVNGVTSAIQTQLDNKLCPTSIAAVSSNITLTNKRIHLVDTSTARSLALPSPTATSVIVVKDATGTAETNNITITRAGSENIEAAAASYVCNTDLGSWTFVSNGTDWFII